MDLKSKIIDIYKKKITLLKKHNKLYFENDDPKISDAEYDILKREIINLEEKNNFLKKLNLNKVIVGSSPSNKFKKVKHLKPMLSLSNAFDKNDMKDFISKISNFLNTKGKNIEFSSTTTLAPSTNSPSSEFIISSISHLSNPSKPSIAS